MRSSAPERSIAAILPGFWPGLGTLVCASRAGTVLLLDERPFSASDGLHRGRIRTTAGDTWLTIPVRSAPPGTPLRAVELASPAGWAPRIMRTLEHAYDEAPYFEHYRCDLARLLFHGFTRLVDLNEAMLRLLLGGYGIPEHILRDSELAGARPLWHGSATSSHLHDRVSDRPALDALLWHGPAARGLIAPVTRGRARPIRLRVFAERARLRQPQPAFGA